MTLTDERAERCETCRFWDKPDATVIGICRRHAPRAMVGWQHEDSHPNFNQWALWPATVETEWCGEWQGLHHDP